MEFAWQHLKNNPFVAITGTNGKTTTTSLTEYIFNSSGRKAITAGNIGKPLSSFVGEIDESTVVVVEISSYQLDHIVDFKLRYELNGINTLKASYYPIIVRAKPPFRGGAQNANQMNQQLHTQFSTVVKSPSPMHLILLIQFVATRMYHPMNYPEKWKSDK